MPDFVSANHGTIVTLSPLTDAARDWVAANIAPDPELSEVVNIEPRYFLDIAYGLLEDGLTMQDAATGVMASLPVEA